MIDRFNLKFEIEQRTSPILKNKLLRLANCAGVILNKIYIQGVRNPFQSVNLLAVEAGVRANAVAQVRIHEFT